MGFFSELKEDLSQAVNELMPLEEDLEQAPAARKTAAEKPVPENRESMELSDSVSLEKMLENIDDIRLPEDEAPEPSLEEMLAAALDAIPEREEPALSGADTAAAEMTAAGMPVEGTAAADTTAAEVLAAGLSVEADSDEAAAAEKNNVQEEIPALREESKGAERTMDSYANRQASDETAVITEGMRIQGDVTSEGSMDVIGTVEGNIEILGKLNITGHISGNSKAAEVYAEGAKINGEIISEGAVKIGDSSVIIGNITAKSAAIAGAVKGDIDVQGPVILDASAIVMGNIKSKSVQINNGAVIEGMCSQCYADVSPTSFFDEYKSEVKSSKKQANK